MGCFPQGKIKETFEAEKSSEAKCADPLRIVKLTLTSVGELLRVRAFSLVPSLSCTNTHTHTDFSPLVLSHVTFPVSSTRT